MNRIALQLGFVLLSVLSPSTTVGVAGNARPRVQPAPWPSARSCHAATYRAWDSSMVILGGATGCGRNVVPDSSIWSWSASRWKRTILAAESPAQREDLLVATDDRNRLLLAYGGRRGSQVFSDLWSWDGQRWRQRSTADGPGQVEHAAAAFDQRRGRMVVFGGGFRSGAPLSDATWEWDGTRWQRFAPPSHPNARVGHSMAWSPKHNGVVLYGGFAEDRYFRDLWLWNGATWTQLSRDGPTTSEGPSVLSWRDGSLLVIGDGDLETVREGGTLRTWEWNGQAWRQVGAGGPPARVGQSIAADALGARLWVVGGSPFPGSPDVVDMWEFKGQDWTRVVPGRGSR